MNVTILCDTREKDPYRFTSKYFKAYCTRNDIHLTVEDAKLDVCDYTIRGYECTFGIERKKLNDFVSRLSKSKNTPPTLPDIFSIIRPIPIESPPNDRRVSFFENQVIPMSQLSASCLILEDNLQSIADQLFYGNLHPNYILSVICHIQALYNVPILPCSNAAIAEQMTFLLLLSWLERFRD